MDSFANYEVRAGSKRSLASTDAKVAVSAKESKIIPTRRFPIVEEEAQYEYTTGIVIRLYDSDMFDALKINDVIDVIGILEHSKLGSLRETGESSLSDTCILPVVHVITFQKQTIYDPSFPYCNLNPDLERDLSQSESILKTRSQLMSLLENALCGDSLVANYLICHLISRIAKPRDLNIDSIPALNIWGLTETPDTGVLLTKLKETLSSVLPQLVSIKADIESLNKGPMLMPIRNPTTYALEAGRLQLPIGTNVLVDETGMSSGQLDARGVLNLRALAMVCTKFQLPYDFQTYQQDWDTDLRVLILSTSQSLIKVNIRNLISATSLLNYAYSLDDPLQQIIKDDFVAWRKNKETFIEVEEFSLLLNLLKLVVSHLALACCNRSYAISHGRKNPMESDWRFVVQMELDRKKRNAQFLKL
ncbi:hypothetical protein Ciccas_000256 [Cichlidogyrus casuarinus]|uniref:Mini-chromosome maintenance complex-binding protein n=1 Tax=Cichlidogyrus casuarinus TaxID=1844966 RepID=A0ABD2QNE1_9PLAT